MKVAFTSTTGETIDQHFGMSDSFKIWEIGPDEAHYVETIAVGAHDDDEEDKIAARAEVLRECAIVYTMQIGGPAAAKLVARKIHPMKTNAEVPVSEVVGKLQEVLRSNPPPWLRKALAKEQGGSFLDE
jgi:nitrogen fixation protein NifX